MRLRRGFDLDPSCKLWMPMYRHGAEVGSRMPDISGNNNHGIITGAVPASYPMLSGVESLANGEFETNPNVQWTPTNSTIASIAGGHSGNCLEITRTGGATQRVTQQFANMAVPLVNGKRYKVSGWVKSGSSGNEAFLIQDDYWGVFPTVSGTSSATWTYYERFWTHIYGSQFELALYKASATAGTMLFDSFSIKEVPGYEGLGWYFDGVSNVITIADNPTLDITDNLTFLTWMKNPQPQYAYIFGKMSGVADAMLAGLVQTNDTLVLLANAGTVWQQLGQSVPFPSGKWSCIGLTYNSVIGGITYYNGVATGAAGGSGVLATNNQPLEIGGVNGSFGKLICAEVVMLNRAWLGQEHRNYFELTRHIPGV